MRLSVLFLVLIFFVSFASAVIPDDCDSSMVAFWRMEGNANDSYKYGYNGTASAGVAYNDNIITKAAVFNGANKITVSNSAINEVFKSRFTLEFWMQTGDTLTGSLVRGGTDNNKFSVGIDNNRLVVNASGVKLNSSTLTNPRNYFVAVVYDSSGSNISLYVDNVRVDSKTITSAPSFTGNLVIGEGFIGLIDEVALYNRTLEESVVISHYLLGSSNQLAERKDYCNIDGSKTQAILYDCIDPDYPFEAYL